MDKKEVRGITMRKMLLTGFEPFLNYKINPTMEVVQKLNGHVMNGWIVESIVLPVDFHESEKKILEKVKQIQPEIVVSLGLAAGRYKITPERIAINVKDGAKDNQGFAPVDQEIDVNGPDGYFSTLPIRKITNHLQELGFPADISNSAGTYLCNNIMYSVLHYVKNEKLNCKAGFIHIPASHELAIQHGNVPSWSITDLTKAIEACLNVITHEG